MCSKHYRHWWEANRAEKCTLDDCDGGQVGKGWCRPHYRHWQRHGHPVIPRPPAPRPGKPKAPCTRDGCEKPQHAKGLCHGDYSAQWYAENTERARTTQAIYRSANRERERLRARAWHCANPERAAATQHRWYVANRDHVRQYRRSYRARNRQAIRLLNAGRRARLRNAPVCDLTAREWHAIKTAYGQRCAYCHHRKPLTIDHVVPLARGGGHTASNVVPACQPCNSRKGDRDAPTYQPLLM